MHLSPGRKMNPSVILINPPLSLQERYGKDMQKFGAVSEPLGIAYIAGYLEAQGIDVRIIDAQAENLDHDQVIRKLDGTPDALVGISLLTPVFDSVKRLCDQIKKIHPETLIVLGGAHCTALPEGTLEEIETADMVCMGEGELTMAEIYSRYVHQGDNAWSEVKGVCYRANGRLIRNDARDFIPDLDRIPPPARHLLPMHKYHLTASRVAGSDYCPTIIVARGCPFKCTYCSRTFGKSFRSHSIERIISEIRFLMDTYKVRQINIEADTLTANKRFLSGLCQAMIDAGFPSKLSWTCESRVDTVTEETLRLMKKAGCWQISYGVETGSQRLLSLISKGVTLKQVEDAFRTTKKLGISIRGFFMLGLPTETPEESRLTIEFAKKLDPLYAQFTVTVPYPGTQMFAELDRNGEIRTYDWGKYNTWSGWKGESIIPFVARGRTQEELSALQKQALREFYMRPKVVFRFLRSIASIYDIQKYLTGFWVLTKSLFKSSPAR
jgi:radical SAM superfamily enzyme YgiQ (UPF0313 family)